MSKSKTKSDSKKLSWLKLRIFIVVVFFLTAFGCIFLRAFQLQVVDGDALSAKARNQHKRVVTLESKRGVIYDRTSHELAVSLDVDSVYANPAKVVDKRRAAKVLGKVLDINSREAEGRLRRPKNFVWIKRQVELSPSEKKALLDIEGIGTVKEARRFYPNIELAGNILGFTGVDAKGLEGIELHYNRYLMGDSVRVVGEKDAKGRFHRVSAGGDVNMPSTDGMSATLTIDRNIQYIAERALGKAVEDSGAKGGVALVMDPATGEILAMANSPTFDPNEFRRFTAKDWRNKSVTDAYEPGSTLKPFLLSAALEEGVVEEEDIFFCENGSYRVADRTFHDIHEFGWLSVKNIIKKSSNIGAAKIGEKLGKEKLFNYLKDFGFGERTGVDLPGESKGLLSNYKRWSAVKLHTASFGHGVSTTALQLVTAISSVANGGFLMKPYVVKSVVNSSGDVVKENHPEIVRRVVSEDTARRVTDLLVSVTDEDGTAYNGRVDGFSVAAKTGTAQKPDLEKGGYKKGAYLASFIGFLPADNPRLAIYVAIDEPQSSMYGGVVSAPVFSDIASETLSYLGLFPDSTEVAKVINADYSEGAALLKARGNGRGKTSGGVTFSGGDEGFEVVPDFKGLTMRRVLALSMGGRDGGLVSGDDLSGGGSGVVNVHVRGSGLAVNQSHGAGTMVKADETVTVWFE